MSVIDLVNHYPLNKMNNIIKYNLGMPFKCGVCKKEHNPKTDQKVMENCLQDLAIHTSNLAKEKLKQSKLTGIKIKRVWFISEHISDVVVFVEFSMKLNSQIDAFTMFYKKERDKAKMLSKADLIIFFTTSSLNSAALAMSKGELNKKISEVAKKIIPTILDTKRELMYYGRK